jgi:hypothetical protein
LWNSSPVDERKEFAPRIVWHILLSCRTLGHYIGQSDQHCAEIEQLVDSLVIRIDEQIKNVFAEFLVCNLFQHVIIQLRTNPLSLGREP